MTQIRSSDWMVLGLGWMVRIGMGYVGECAESKYVGLVMERRYVRPLRDL